MSGHPSFVDADESDIGAMVEDFELDEIEYMLGCDLDIVQDMLRKDSLVSGMREALAAAQATDGEDGPKHLAANFNRAQDPNGFGFEIDSQQDLEMLGMDIV